MKTCKEEKSTSVRSPGRGVAIVTAILHFRGGFPHWSGSFFKQHLEMETGRMPEALGVLQMPCLDFKVSGEKQIWLNQCTKEKNKNPVLVLSMFKFGLY